MPTVQIWCFNPYHANIPFLYVLKISEKQRFSDVFTGHRKETLAWNGLIFMENKRLKEKLSDKKGQIWRLTIRKFLLNLFVPICDGIARYYFREVKTFSHVY